MSNQYERIYEVGLLDDLHNYFPALLYQSDIFQTVPDVLAYVRDRIIRRFNLFDHGRRQYENNIPLFPQYNTFIPQNTGYQRTGNSTTYNAQANATGYSQNPQARDEVHLEFTSPAASTLLPLFRSLNNTRTRRNATVGVPYEDVIVHASQIMIDGASTEQTLSEDLDTICTICQDRMRQGELTRKLNACNHDFHRSCIDNWLLTRSVRCPTCRHDIREPRQSPLLTATPAATSASATSASATSAAPTSPPDIDNMLPTDLIDLLFRRLL